MLQGHYDGPERVILAQPQRIAQSVEARAFFFGRATADHLGERILHAHEMTWASTFRTSLRHRPNSARLPMGSDLAATLRASLWVQRSSATRSARSGNVTDLPPRRSTDSRILELL